MYSLASCYFGIILHVHASAEPEIHFLGGGGMWYEGYLCLLGEVGVGWGWKAFYYMNYNKYSMGGGGPPSLCMIMLSFMSDISRTFQLFLRVPLVYLENCPRRFCSSHFYKDRLIFRERKLHSVSFLVFPRKEV